MTEGALAGFRCGFPDGGDERGAQGGELQGRDLSLGEIGGASAAKADLGQGFFENAAAIEVDVEAACQNDECGVEVLGTEEEDGGGRSGGDTRGQEFNVIGIAVFPGAIDEAQAAVNGNLDGEARGVVVGELFAEALAIFHGGFGIGFEALDGSGNVGGSDGESGGELAEDGGGVAGGVDGAEAADKFDASAAADFLSTAQEQAADLAGGTDVGSTAGIAVDAVNLDEADVAGALGQLAQFTGDEHGLGFGAGDVAAGDAAVFRDDFVYDTFDALDAVVGDGATGEVDGGVALAEMEGDGGRVQLAQKDGGEEMLACMLLHVVEAAFPVDVAFDRRACGKRLADEVPDLAVFIFFDGFDRNVEGGASTGDGAEKAEIAGLAAAGGIKGGAVEGDLPDRFTLLAGELTDVSNNSGERLEKRIGIIKPLRYRHSVTPRLAHFEPRQIETGKAGGQPRFSVVREPPTVSNYSVCRFLTCL